MLKNLTSNQILLMAISAGLLLVAALSFFLLQDPSAPLPFMPSTSTTTFTPPAATMMPLASATASPTRQTSYTPFATLLTPEGTLLVSSPIPTLIGEGTSVSPGPTQTIKPGGATSTISPIGSTTPKSTRTPTSTLVSTTHTITPSPTISGTLSAGEIGVTGRIMLNGTPMANVIVEFKDDVDARQAATIQGGHYLFTTYAPGAGFSLTFDYVDNPQLTPAGQIASLGRIEGTLPVGVNTIDLPDFEVSLNLNNMIFAPQIPVDGATYSASFINSANKIQFIWDLYGLGGSYRVELGPNGSEDPIWRSALVADSDEWWDGTLSDGTHITQGTYWWRVCVTRSQGGYVETICTRIRDIMFNP